MKSSSFSILLESKQEIQKRLVQIKQIIMRNIFTVNVHERKIIQNALDSVMNSKKSEAEKMSKLQQISSAISSQVNGHVREIERIRQIVRIIEKPNSQIGIDRDNSKSGFKQGLLQSHGGNNEKELEKKARHKALTDKLNNLKEAFEQEKTSSKYLKTGETDYPYSEDVSSQKAGKASILDEALENVKNYRSKNRRKRKRRTSSSDEETGDRFRIQKDSLYPERDLISDESLNFSLSYEEREKSRKYGEGYEEDIEKDRKSRKRYSKNRKEDQNEYTSVSISSSQNMGKSESQIRKNRESYGFSRDGTEIGRTKTESDESENMISQRSIMDYKNRKGKYSLSNEEEFPYGSLKDKDYRHRKSTKSDVLIMEGEMKIEYTNSNENSEENIFSFRKKKKQKHQPQSFSDAFFDRSRTTSNQNSNQYNNNPQLVLFNTQNPTKQNTYNTKITKQRMQKVQQRIRNRIMVSPASAFAVQLNNFCSNQDQIDQRFRKQSKEVQELVQLVAGKKAWNWALMKKKHSETIV